MPYTSLTVSAKKAISFYLKRVIAIAKSRGFPLIFLQRRRFMDPLREGSICVAEHLVNAIEGTALSFRVDFDDAMRTGVFEHV